jgi:hypothetical protein
MNKEEDKKEFEIKIRCSKTFYDIIIDYQKRFYDKHKVNPTIPETTDIIATKIKKFGGLIV